MSDAAKPMNTPSDREVVTPAMALAAIREQLELRTEMIAREREARLARASEANERTAAEWNQFLGSEMALKAWDAALPSERDMLDRLTMVKERSYVRACEAIRADRDDANDCEAYNNALADSKFIWTLLLRRVTEGVDAQRILRHYCPDGASMDVVSERDEKGHVKRVIRYGVRSDDNVGR